MHKGKRGTKSTEHGTINFKTSEMIGRPKCKYHNDYQVKLKWLFGIDNEPLLSYLILCCKFYIYKCRFQNSTPNFTAFKSFLVLERKIEYGIAYKNDKLSKHLKKWCFDF